MPPGAALEWTEVAHGARFSHHLLTQVGEPRAGSYFAKIQSLYPFESPAAFTRGYLDAALEHLLLWADYAAPLKFPPEHQVTFRLRPAYTLARDHFGVLGQNARTCRPVDPLAHRPSAR